MPDPFGVLPELRVESGERWVDIAADFQLEDAGAVLGDARPYHWLGRPRGGSKTTDAGAIALGWLLTGPPGARYYAGAGDRDQARLLLDAVGGFVRRTPGLADRVRVDAGRAVAIETGATLTVLSADAPTSWGILPDGIVVDEVAWWPDGAGPRLLFDSLASSAAKVAGCRLLVITSPSDPAHFAHKIYSGALVDPLWRVSEQTGPPPWLDPAKVEEQRRRLTPAMFERLFEGRWATGEDRLTTEADLEACVVLDGPQDAVSDARYAIGVDLGLRRDRTAVAVCHRAADGRIVLDRLAVWRGSRLRAVRLDEVERWIETAARDYNGALAVIDPYQAEGLAQRLEGSGVRVELHPFTSASVARLAGTLFGLLRDRRLALPDDEELLDELRHVRIVERSPGVFRLDHDAGRHDDRAIALALAAATLQREPDAPGPPGVGPIIWDGGFGWGGGIPLGGWVPQHVGEFDDRRRAHLKTRRALRVACDECLLEEEARRAAAAAPTPAPTPERVGSFLITRQPKE